MVLSSAIFLFAFFPVVFALYHLVPGVKGKNAVLAVFSLLFYCFGRLTDRNTINSAHRSGS